MNKIILTFAVIALMYSSCTNPPKRDNSSQPDTGLSKSLFRTLLVIGDDRSGSTGDIRKLTSDDYQLLSKAIADHGGGVLSVCLIGNPHPQSREPFNLVLPVLKQINQYDPRDPKLTLTEKTQLKLANEKILAANKELQEKNPQLIDQFIRGTITTQVTSYKPTGVDNTNLDDAIARINTLVNEPQYRDYEKIVIAIISDGINQPGRSITPIRSGIENPRAELYLIGWETSTDCFTVGRIEKLSSKDAFIEIIKNLN